VSENQRTVVVHKSRAVGQTSIEPALRQFILGRGTVPPTDIRALRAAGYLEASGNFLKVTPAGWIRLRGDK
jgi:hypothetical protein